MAMGPIASAVGRNLGQQLGERDYQEVLGKCKVDKQGNYYTHLPKMVRRMVAIGDLILLICIVGMLILSGISESGLKKEDLYFVIGATIFLLIYNIASIPVITYRHILTANGLQKKRIGCNRFLSYEEIHACSKQWPIMLYKGNAVIMGKDTMVKINFMNNVGGADFLMKLGERANVYMNRDEMIDALIRRRHKETTGQKEEYLRRVAFLKQ